MPRAVHKFHLSRLAVWVLTPVCACARQEPGLGPCAKTAHKEALVARIQQEGHELQIRFVHDGSAEERIRGRVHDGDGKNFSDLPVSAIEDHTAVARCPPGKL